jgi:hypothetical protein
MLLYIYQQSVVDVFIEQLICDALMFGPLMLCPVDLQREPRFMTLILLKRRKMAGCIAGRSCFLIAVCFARQEEVEARDQGQLDDLLQLHRQSHEKERDEGIRLQSLD